VKANCWTGPNKVEVQDVPDPKILNSRDAVVKITSTAICGSDLHLLDGYVPTMKSGDVLGHEFMGEVVEVGPGVDGSRLRVGDRVVVPFPIACGACLACRAELYSCCENTNPNAGVAEKMFGHPVAGIFGYSHLTGGFAGGQAEYARVPFADVGPIRIESDLADEHVLFLSDILPTGYRGAEMCDIEDGDVVAVWGAGPVGQFAMDSARVLGAAMVIAIDDIPYRLEMAASRGYRTIDYSDTDVRSALLELTVGAARTSASTPSAWRPRTGRPTCTSTTGSSRRSARRATGRMPCARRSCPAAAAGSSRSSGSTAGWSTSSRPAPG
jgi:threonine dehydrogenase-like Zn-dependent dehydrogenase